MIVLDREKQPWERKDYDVDHSLWLPEGDPVASASIGSVVCLDDPVDIALIAEPTLGVTSPRVKVWVTGGTSNRKYKITIRAITVADRRIESEILIRVKDR